MAEPYSVTQEKRHLPANMKQYCTAMGKNPDELIAFKIEGIRNITSAIEFQPEDLVVNYLQNVKYISVQRFQF